MAFMLFSALASLPLWVKVLLVLTSLFLVNGFKPAARWRLRRIPGPRPDWYLGNIRQSRKLKAHVAHLKWTKQYGPIFTSWAGSQPFVFVNDPILARQVLLLNYNRPAFRSIWSGKEREFDAASILAARGDKHRSLRGAWQPVFFSGSLELFAALMNEANDLLLARLGNAADQRQILDVHKALGNLTLDVIGYSAFGVKFHVQEATMGVSPTEHSTKVDNLLAAVEKLFDIPGLTFSWYGPLILFFPSLAPVARALAAKFPDKGILDLRKARNTIIDTVKHLIDEHRLHLAEEKKLPVLKDTLALRKGVAAGSFLDLLLRSVDRSTKAGFTDVEITNQAYIMLLAGYETTANALTFAVYLLSQHKDKEAKMLAEIDRFGRDRKPCYEDLDKFPYTDAVFKETVRVFPPAPTLVREAQNDMQIGPYHIGKGEWLGVSIYAVHHDEKYWKNPEEFIPERFVEGTPEAAERPQYSYIPFGDGTRACIGLRFAREEALITLIRMYQQYTFDLEPGQVPLEVRSTITIAPKQGVMCRVRRRAEE
eukprot:jgi/Botrbrau1/9248/Bobra.180_1s0009.1